MTSEEIYIHSEESSNNLRNHVSCPAATWWELWWARSKLWHTATMSERYFRLIANEFELLPEPKESSHNDHESYQENCWLWNKANAKMRELDAKIQQRRKLHLTEVFGLELLTLRLLPDERLIAKAWSIRDAYQRLVPGDMYREYEKSCPPTLCREPKKDENNVQSQVQLQSSEVQAKLDAEQKIYFSKVRADAEDLLNGTYWWYTNSNYREKRIQAVKRKLIGGLLFCAVLVILLSACTAVSPAVMLFTVTLMGMMGAILSIGRRMLVVSSQNITESDPIIKATQFDHGGTGLLLSIFVGGAFAIVLYFLMVAGLSDAIGTSFVPEFDGCKSDCNSMNGFFMVMIPDCTASFAKLLCWSFLAGFAEKFVPDILDRMAKNDNGVAK